MRTYSVFKHVRHLFAGMNVRVKKKRKQTAKELTMSFIDNYYRTVKNTPLSNCVRHLHLLQGNT